MERVEKSDRGTFEVTYKVSGNDLTQAYQKLNQDTEVTQNFIIKAGFAPQKYNDSGTPSDRSSCS